MAPWINAHDYSRQSRGAAFVFGLIGSAISEEATEILLTRSTELDMVLIAVDCSVKSRPLTRPFWRTFALHLVLIGNGCRGDARTERLCRDRTKGSYIFQLQNALT